MKLTLAQAFEAIERGETSEEYSKRIAKLQRLLVERDFLQDAIEVLTGDPRVEKKQKRLSVVLAQIDALK